MAPEAVVERTSCSFDCPCRSPIARRRELAHPCAQTCVPFPRARHRGGGTANGAGFCFDAGHPWPRSTREPTTCFVAPSAHDARRSGPLEHGERTTEMSEGWRTGGAPVRRRHKDVPSANPGGRSRTRSTWMCGGRVRGVAFSLVTFLLATQEKVTRAPGRGAEKDMDVVIASLTWRCAADCFCRNKSGTLALEASGTRTGMSSSSASVPRLAPGWRAAVFKHREYAAPRASRQTPCACASRVHVDPFTRQVAAVRASIGSRRADSFSETVGGVAVASTGW